MAKGLKITIGIPCYNAEMFLAQSIVSVINQTFRDWELVIVDDGSTDQSLSIAKSFNDERIRIITDGTNKGISYRLNQLIQEAKGEFFCRMDADDIMFPDRLKIQLKYFLDNPEIDVVGSYAVVIDEDSKILGLRKSTIPNHINECFKAVPFIHPTVMGKTNWFRKYGYTNDLKGVEDADLWIRSFSHSKFAIIQKPLLFYRDPLTLKLKTYRFRIGQYVKLIKQNQSQLKYPLFFSNKFLIIAIAKLCIYSTLKFFKIESIAIKRRNIRLSTNEISKYNSILLHD